MHATDILAYIHDGAVLCAEHGAEHDNGEDDGASPIFADGGSEFAAVEYCDNGHSFCMSCGSDTDDDDINGHFSQCWNCHTESVYIDGVGRDWLSGGWADALDTHYVKVYVSPGGRPVPRPMTDGNNYATVTAILDESSGPIRKVAAFVAYLQHSPIDGNVLVLANTWGDAYDSAQEYFVEKCEPANEDDAADLRSDVMCQEIPTGQVWFTTKR